MNFNKIFLVCLALLAFACQEDNTSFGDFNYQRQYDTEKVEINSYLETHYYDESTNLFQDLVEGKTALLNDSELQTINVNFNNVAYQMYYYEIEEGTEDLSPDNNDRVNIILSILELDNTEIVVNESSEGVFFNIDERIIGLREGLPYFKPGTFDESDITTPRQYSNFGRGFLIIPSGLTFISEGQDLNSSRVSSVASIYRIGLRLVTKIDNVE